MNETSESAEKAGKAAKQAGSGMEEGGKGAKVFDVALGTLIGNGLSAVIGKCAELLDAMVEEGSINSWQLYDGLTDPVTQVNLLDTAITNGATTFWVGGYGAFDSYAAGCVRRLKKEYPQISLDLILAYLPIGKHALADAYDSTIYPEGLELVPQRFAISKRNRWIVDNCDMIIAYVRSTYGGAYTQR